MFNMCHSVIISADIIFSKAAKVLPGHSWRIMYGWYSYSSVRIKWKKMLNGSIRVSVGRDTGVYLPHFLSRSNR